MEYNVIGSNFVPHKFLHASIFHPTLRRFTVSIGKLSPFQLMYPVFILDCEDAKEEVASMPGVFRYGVSSIQDALEPLVQMGLKSVLLFGVVKCLPKDLRATHADSQQNPVIRAIPILRRKFPDLLIATDVCLCAYTSHGHCGILNTDGTIDNTKSIFRLAEVATAYAKAGCHVVAPSDMMDGRVGAIKSALNSAGLASRVSLLSYAVKFSSSFYGPFRDAAASSPSFGDRQSYQLPVGSAGLAARAAARDIAEGCDMLMVKPGLPYLDILRQIKQDCPEYPLFVYQVSGEYAMLHHAAKAGALELKRSVLETMTSFRRAGADCIITYFAPQLLEWLKDD